MDFINPGILCMHCGWNTHINDMKKSTFLIFITILFYINTYYPLNVVDEINVFKVTTKCFDKLLKKEDDHLGRPLNVCRNIFNCYSQFFLQLLLFIYLFKVTSVTSSSPVPLIGLCRFLRFLCARLRPGCEVFWYISWLLPAHSIQAGHRTVDTCKIAFLCAVFRSRGFFYLSLLSAELYRQILSIVSLSGISMYRLYSVIGLFLYLLSESAFIWLHLSSVWSRHR